MDTITLVIGLILLMFLVQYGQAWLVFGALAILILSLRSLKSTIFLLVAVGVFYYFASEINTFWPIALFGMIVVSLLLGIGGKEEQSPEYYAPDLGGYGGMGMGGY